MSFGRKIFKYFLIKNWLKQNNQINFTTENQEKPTIYLFFVACGTNMGDHAIVRAETDFIKQCLGDDTPIVEIKVSETEDAIGKLKKKIKESDLIIFSGGGYLGDEYVEVFSPLIRIMRLFKNHRMLVFPQTVFFKNAKCQSYFMKLCKKCKKITIFVRERESEAIFLKNDISVLVVPDIVLSEKVREHKEYDNILLCMRRDVERALSTAVEESIIKQLQIQQKQIVITDTVLKDVFDIRERFAKLEEMWENFSRASLIVTDRIHGMVFAYLTKTPCIALGNYNHKVRAEYKWLEECNYIRYVDVYDENEFQRMVQELLDLEEYYTVTLAEKFDTLKGELQKNYAKGI